MKVEVARLFEGQYRKLMPTFVLLHDALLAEGCVAYVKTGYVGFELAREMVASVHPAKGDRFELALALPEDYLHPDLYDAAHLKWRTLPVAVEIYNKTTLKRALPLVQKAVQRVAAGQHNVHLDNTRFAKHPRAQTDLPEASQA